jgi:hypothetical protein
VLAAAAIVVTAGAGADANSPTPPLPVFTPTPTDWAPNFAYPNNLYQSAVTDGDINAERDICEWFNAQFDTLMHKINDLKGNLAGNGDFGNSCPTSASASRATIRQASITSLSA